LYGRIIISKTVYEELKKKKDGVLGLVEKGMKEGWITVQEGDKDLMDDILSISGIHKGVAETIAIALARNDTAVIDERVATRMARACGIKSVGLIGVIAEAMKVEAISYNEGVNYIEELIENGFRLSYRDYKRIMKEIEGLEELRG
jgi:Predicted nucleic acid-binding protein, contains PIN domain